MSDELGPLPPSLRRVLDVDPPQPPPGFEEAVLSRLEASLTPAPVGTPAPSTVASGAVALSKKVLVAGAVTFFGAGVGAGALATHALRGDDVAPPVPTLAHPVAPPPPLTLVPTPPAAPTIAPVPVVRPPTVKVSPRPLPPLAPVVGGRDEGLAAERALLEQARTSLAKGDARRALESLEEHERTFPGARLAEEREVLAIQALAQEGKRNAALERAARFRGAFPDSLMLPAVDASLAQ